MTAFELRHLPDDKGRGRLYLVQLPLRTERMPVVEMPTTIGRIEGSALRLAQDAIAATIEQPIAERDTLTISETKAIRLGIIFHAVQSLRSSEKVQEMIEKINRMRESEASFWLEKLTGEDAEFAKKSLVVMLTGAV